MAAALPLVAAGVTAVGQVQQGRAAQRAAQAQATIQNQQAADERRLGAIEASDFRFAQSAEMASSRARFGASGISTAGTPGMVTADTVGQIAAQSQRIQENAAIRAGRLDQQAALTRAAGKSRRRGANMAAFGTLLTGFSKFQEQFASFAGGGSGGKAGKSGKL